MPARGKAGRYHHGNLRAALIAIAIELIAERGVHGFSLAEASRRLGVTASAPYAHFDDRGDLLAAVAVHAWELCGQELVAATAHLSDPADRLAAMARGYVRFAVAHRPLFRLLSSDDLDPARHPEIKAAERPVSDTFLACVRTLAGEDATELARAIEATAHGHALLLEHDADPGAVRAAAERAGRATRTLIRGRDDLLPPAARD